MEITREDLRKAGTVAGVGVIGAGLGAGALTYVDDSPTEDKVQNLKDSNQELEEKVNSLEERPTQDDVDALNSQIDDLSNRPTVEEYTSLQNELSNAFTQEEVDEMVADATEREGLVDYLPVIADEDIEIEETYHASDRESNPSNLGWGVQGTSNVGDTDDYEGEDHDAISVDYNHDFDDHDYKVVVTEFEDSQDAEEYADELDDHVDAQDYDETTQEDAAVIKDGDTVVYVYGSEGDSDEPGFDDHFDTIVSQY